MNTDDGKIYGRRQRARRGGFRRSSIRACRSGVAPVLVWAVVLAAAAGRGAEEGWRPPEIKLPEGAGHPLVACTPEELARVRAAWSGKGAEHRIVAGLLRRAAAACDREISFPPRGGQHNQWYQCDKCEAGLKTVDDTHHKCPVCERVYSGPPYDDVVFGRRHHRLLAGMHDAAWAYAITGEAKYAEHAAKILLGYADRYLAYPFHSSARFNVIWGAVAGGRLFEQTLSEASAMATRIAPAYDLIHDSPALSEADHDKIRSGLLLPLLENVDKYKAGVVNWQSWHNAAMFVAGAVLRDVSWMKKAVHGGENESLLARTMSLVENMREKDLKKAGNDFLFQMEHSVTSDGMWYENSWGYHFYALQALVITVEAARRVGLDLWGCPRFKTMFTLPARYTMPDGKLPRFADDVNSSAKGRVDLLEPAYAAYRDPALLALLPARPSWHTILSGRDLGLAVAEQPLDSALFRGAGHAILRTPGQAGLVTAFAFGAFGGYHAHYDRLSFVFYAFGRELGVDRGRAKSQAYRLPIHKNWYKATISHNTVMAGRRSQAGVSGTLEFFASSDRCAAVAARCDRAYAGVRHRRLLVQTPDYLVVVDDLEADEQQQFSWLYHNRGLEAVCAVAAETTELKDKHQGGEYIREAKTGKTSGSVRIAFRDEAVTNHVIIAGQPGTTVVVGDGPGGSVKERIPLAILVRQGRRVRFVAVLEPRPTGRPSRVGDVADATSEAGLLASIKHAGAEDVIRLSGDNRLQVVSAGETLLSYEPE